MSAETINEKTLCSSFLGHEKISKIIEGDIILQDIKPNILSVIKVSSDIFVSEKNIKKDAIEIKGTIDVCMIYVAEDSNGDIRSATMKIDYQETLPFKGVDENTKIKLWCDIDSLQYKVLGSRKVNIKSECSFHAMAFSNEEINIIKGINDTNDLQMLKETICMQGKINSNKAVVELKENIKLGEENLPIEEILCSKIRLINKEFKISYNKILAKAEAEIKIIYMPDGNACAQTFETTIPVMSFIDAEGVDENSKINIDYFVSQFDVKATYQDLQAMGVCIDGEILVCAEWKNESEAEIVTDVYSPNCDIKIEKEIKNILSHQIDVTEKFDIAQGLVVPELANTKILSVDGKANVIEKNILSGKVAIIGNIDIEILYCKLDSKIIEVKKLELPYKFVSKIEKIESSMDPHIVIKIEKIKYHKGDENQIQVDINLESNIIVNENIKIDSIEKIELSDEAIQPMPSVIVYFIKHGDTLWKIAKEFKSTVKYIKEVNGLKEDLIHPGDRLIIPKLVMGDEVKSLM